MSDNATTSAEHESRCRDADHEHQRARVGHVVAKRSMWSLAQAVEVQHAVLHDAVRRGSRAHGDNHVRHGRRPLTAREVVYRRHDEEQDKLSTVATENADEISVIPA